MQAVTSLENYRESLKTSPIYDGNGNALIRPLNKDNQPPKLRPIIVNQAEVVVPPRVSEIEHDK